MLPAVGDSAQSPRGASGAGVCLGYINRAELTVERFIDWTPPQSDVPIRLYKSGDLARRLPDGDLVYLGRIDHRAKIRGFRIETGEVESELAKHPGLGANAEPRALLATL
jgi:non-ribosomal peptide synthetase component F